jgi:hypothetical protein
VIKRRIRFGNEEQVEGPVFARFPLLLIALFWIARPAAGQQIKPVTPRIGEVTIDRFKELQWHPETNYFNSPGSVRITIVDLDTGQKTVLIADDAEGTPGGDIVVKGRLRLERQEGIVTGRAGTYHGDTQTGEVLDAEARVAGALLRGAKVELITDAKGRRVLRAVGGYFTTCVKTRPDYHITAREIRVRSDRRVSAKGVGFYLGSVKLITLPSLEKNFSHTVESPVPLPGYSRENFLSMRFRNSVTEEPKTYFAYDIAVSLKHTPSGTLHYEQDLGQPGPDEAPPRTRQFAITEPQRTALETTPALLAGTGQEPERRRTTLYGLLTTNTFVYNRQRTDLQISRLPEVGISLRNILNRQPVINTEGAGPRAPSVFRAGFFSPANWLMNAEVGVGYMRERPTGAEAIRLGARADATSPLFYVTGPLYVRYGATAWANLYGNGNAYTLLAPEAEIDALLGRDSLIGVGYRYQKDFGKTPFLFDRRDVRHELRLRYSYLGSAWAYDTEIKYDLERVRAYDSLFSIRKRFDCMEIGLAYRTRSQGISLIFNLLPTAPTRVITRQPAAPTR